MKQPGEIILLSGAHCSGKTTLSFEIRRIIEKPFLATGYDDFLPFLGLRYVGLDKSIQPDTFDWPVPGESGHSHLGLEIRREERDGQTIYEMMLGEVAWNLIAGMHRAFAAMARAGNNLVLGEVNTEPMLKDCLVALKGLKVYLIGIHCSLEELERRETAMPTRSVGCARMQIDKVHVPGDYDFIVDSEKHTAAECAEQIVEFVGKTPPAAFDRLSERYGEIPEVTEFPVQWW